MGIVLSLLFLSACSDEEIAWNPYNNWESRNASWYEQVSDTARTAIAKAKAQYGDAWEEHCQWRQFKSLRMSAGYDTKDMCDSICVKILKSGDREAANAVCPLYSDTVRVNYRGWLMNATYENNQGERYEQMQIFDQSYFGAFDESLCAPSKMAVSVAVDGFGTALQYMIPGDDWLVYIPQKLAYGAKESSAVPAYSTLLFRLNLVAVYHPGTKVPSWK